MVVLNEILSKLRTVCFKGYKLIALTIIIIIITKDKITVMLFVVRKPWSAIEPDVELVEKVQPVMVPLRTTAS